MFAEHVDRMDIILMTVRLQTKDLREGIDMVTKEADEDRRKK